MSEYGLLNGLELSQLKDIYTHTHSMEVLEHIKNAYGMSGLRKVDVNYAVGFTNLQLQQEPEVLMAEMSSCNLDDLISIFTLLYDVLQNCIRTENEETFEGLCTIINNMYLHHADPRRRDKIREFVRAILYYLFDTQEDKDDIARRNDLIPGVMNALLYNPTLTKNDVFEWLADFPMVVKQYVRTYLEVAREQRMVDEMPESFADNISFTTVMMLLVEFYHYMNAYNDEYASAGKEINIEQNLYDVLLEIILDIETQENPTTYSNFYDLFMETAYSGITKNNKDYLNMLRRFWTIWLLEFKELITTNDGVDWDVAFDEGDIDFYDTVMSWYVDIADRCNAGLIHVLYHRAILDDYDRNITAIGENRVSREEINAAIEYMIKTEKLDESFFISPMVYLENAINEYFSSVADIKRLNEENGIENIDYSDNLLDEISGG